MWWSRLKQETLRSKEVFVEHFRRKYGDCHNSLPIWMAAEIMTFGLMFTLYRGLNDGLKKKVANHFHVEDIVFKSWLGSLNAVRNICAHHGRLWNRILGYKPKLPYQRKHPEWDMGNDRLFVILTIIQYLLKQISPSHDWKAGFYQLLVDYPDIPRNSMGIPIDFQNQSIWQ